MFALPTMSLNSGANRTRTWWFCGRIPAGDTRRSAPVPEQLATSFTVCATLEPGRGAERYWSWTVFG
jgi:hypothetical protein